MVLFVCVLLLLMLFVFDVCFVLVGVVIMVVV